MREDFTNIPLYKNEEKKRFEIEIDNSIAFVTYKETGNQIALLHTEVESALSGRGIAGALVEKTLQYIEDHNKTVLPYCSYILSYIQKHPEKKKLVDPSFKEYNKL
ncbi:GNAT family N-acetyltransferase [Lacinutrix sp. MEBiC02404]